MKRLVADTGPLLHLHQAGAIQLLPQIGEVFIPSVVVVELQSFVSAMPPDWVKVPPLSPSAERRADDWVRADLLHVGEAHALALALERTPDWFLTDDAAARLMAESLNIETHGSIGILLWAAANELVKVAEARALFDNLEKSSLWMSPKVRNEARAAMERIFNSSKQ